MESKSIKISKENYLWLLKIAAELQQNQEKPVSFDEAISELKEKKMKKGKDIMEFAGIWENMTDEEAKKLKKDLKKGWKKWKIPSL